MYPRTHGNPGLVFQVLELQASTTMPVSSGDFDTSQVEALPASVLT